MTRWAIAGLLALGACRSSMDDGVLARGTIEVPEVDLAPMVGARVVTIRVDEGDTVAPGDTVAILTQTELPAAIAAQEARVRAARAQLADLQAGARPQEIRQAETAVTAAEAEANRTARDAERVRALGTGGAVSRQAVDDAEAAATIAAERLQSAKESLALLEAGSRADRIGAARADLATAEASLRMTEARVGDLVLVSPVAGRVLYRLAEPGEVVGPNVPVVTVAELGRSYVRAYVRASALATLSVGDAVVVAADGIEGTRAPGRIAAVSPEAEFTPRVALTQEERADLMFAIKVELGGGRQGLYPGMWAVIRREPASPGGAP
ncbi:MAG: HlyD family secretion protein [Gemmatimonadales bacterium]